MERGETGYTEESDSASRIESSSLAQSLQQALARQLRDVIGSERFGSSPSQLISWQTGLVAGLSPDLLGHRLADLQPRLTRPDTAMALVLNSFLPWLDQVEALQLADIGRFQELNFDARCPTGVRGTPPHIELVASGPAGVVGATACVFDYLAMRQSSLSAAYLTLTVPPSLTPWITLMHASADGTDDFRYVDVPALSKLAVGLGRIFAFRPVRLLYLFLEPADAADVPVFAAHRAELARLVERTRESSVSLLALSFHELWQAWCADVAPTNLRAVAAQLQRRYAVAIPR